MTGAHAAVKTIKEHGLNFIFGIPGVQNLEYFDAFASEDIDVILVSHELSASFMADAVGRVTGEPGVVVVVPGPGLTNIFTGLGEALLDSAPVLALVPGVRTDFKESFQLHQIDQEGAAKALAKGYFKVDSADDIPGAVARAIQRAKSGEPGPVIFEAPYNVLLESTSKGAAKPLEPEYPVPDDNYLDQAAQLILSSKRPGIHAGLGAAAAAEQVMELAARLDAPVSTTISGRGVIPEDHDLSVGFGFGPAGSELAERVFKDRDLVIAVGCKFSEVGSGSYSLRIPRLVHIDANPDVLGANFPADVKLAGDAGRVLSALLERIREKRPLVERSGLRDTIRTWHEKRRTRFEQMSPWRKSVNPARLLWELRKRAPRDAILVTDSGAHTFWTVFCYDAYMPRSVLSPIDYSSMGYAIPGAIGASLAAPQRRVIASVGDGGLLMTGTEMATAQRLGLPLMVVLFNDRALGMIRQTQKLAYRRETAVDLEGPDYGKFASAFGFDYVRINSDGDLAPGLDRAFDIEGPVLVDALVEYRGQTRHTVGTARSIIRRMPPSVLVRMAARAAWRTIAGD